MNQIIDLTVPITDADNEAAITPDEMAILLKEKAPSLADLSQDQLKAVARLVMTRDLVDELAVKKNLAGVDWQKERENFLSDAKSGETRRAYRAALDRLELWAKRQDINLLALSAREADQFIRDLRAGHIPAEPKGRVKNGKRWGGRPLPEGVSPAPASSRRAIAAVSAFYSRLERYHAAVINPFRGTRIRPPRVNEKEILIPSQEEYERIIVGVPAVERAMIKCMAIRGLRVGALPTLRRSAGRYYGVSKGKRLTEGETDGIELPVEAVRAIADAGLDIKAPFAWTNTRAIERRVGYRIGKLYKTRMVKDIYSCHDFRHFFAIREYTKDKDIVRVSKLLNHTSITVTQLYLRSLKVEL
jgi:integrase